MDPRANRIENGIADRRELYNESVNIYNVRIEQFPDTLIANMLHFTEQPLLEFSSVEKSDVDLKTLFS